MDISKTTVALSVAVILSLLFACSSRSSVPGDRVYTLYRNSVTDQNIRVHVATFDADQEESYNRDNCDIAQHQFQAQPGIKTRFWCEKGYFRK